MVSLKKSDSELNMTKLVDSHFHHEYMDFPTKNYGVHHWKICMSPLKKHDLPWGKKIPWDSTQLPSAWAELRQGKCLAHPPFGPPHGDQQMMCRFGGSTSNLGWDLLGFGGVIWGLCWAIMICVWYDSCICLRLGDYHNIWRFHGKASICTVYPSIFGYLIRENHEKPMHGIGRSHNFQTIPR